VNVEHGNYADIPIFKPVYVPVRERAINEIKIEMRSEDGELLVSNFGESEIKLHFRQLS
jgi:hypothetical protein